jgi:hypothetical protein
VAQISQYPWFKNQIGVIGFRQSRGSEVVVGELMEVPKDGGGVDGMQQVTAESGTWLSSLIVSSNGEEVRSERLRASAVSVEHRRVDFLRDWMNGGRQHVCQREGKKLGRERGRGLTGGCRI